MYSVLFSVISLLVISSCGGKIVTEDKCSPICNCEREENSSKVIGAMCSVNSQEDSLECSVEWPALMLTLKKVQYDSTLLQKCKRVKRLMISSESYLAVLRSDMFKYSSDLQILIVKAPIQTVESVLLRHLASLRHLDISETKLESISRSIFEECPISDMLRLVSNQISYVEDDSFKNCIYLLKLDLSRNKLRKINFSTFEGTFNLEMLDLSKNKIESIDDRSFKSLRRLKILFLNGNSLSSIKQETFGNLESLTHLRLDSNKITYIALEAFKNLKNIQLINLKENTISNLDLILFLNLKYLKITFPEIDCVRTRKEDYQFASVGVIREFEKHPLCIGSQKPFPTQPNVILDNQKLVQKEITKSFQSTSKPKEKDSILSVIENHPYLIPMILGGLTVAVISIIVLSVVCHIKNKRINELRLQELQLPMMQSTL